MQKHVFYDDSKKRWTLIKRVAVVAAVIAAIVGSIFLVSLIFFTNSGPTQNVAGPARRVSAAEAARFPKKKKLMQRFILARILNETNKLLAEEKARAAQGKAPAKKGDKIVAAFFTIWEEAGIHSLNAHADKLTHIMPEWLHLAKDGEKLDLYDWNPKSLFHNKEVVDIARKYNLEIMPVMNNAVASTFDLPRVQLLFSSKTKQRRLAQNVKKWLLENHFQGINIDFENLDQQTNAYLPDFIKYMAEVLHPAGLKVSLDIEPDNDMLDWGAAAKYCDFAVVMAYDEHHAGNKVGPLASMGWYTNLLEKALNGIPAEKLVVGLGNYAYDWNEKKNKAVSMTFQQALITARDNRPEEKPSEVIDFDPNALNPTFNYIDDKDYMHEVWFLDAITAANQWTIAQQENIKGAVLWVLGSEDPSIWDFFDHQLVNKEINMTLLEKMSYPYDVSFYGAGDILKIRSMPQKGARVIDVDQQSDLCTDETYQAFPSPFVFERNGLQPKTVALTFDDGPYEPYTSQVLDKLKELGVHATFFVIGQNLARHPELAERMWREGHELGNHSWSHPNLGQISEARARLELNGTERIIESILGRSTLLFRAPYNADAEPKSAEEVWPVVFASKLGYITVGESVDPQDWNPKEVMSDGTIQRRTVKDIADTAIQMVHTGIGNAILLHDGGGNRSMTVAAIEPIVKTLKAEGYKFGTISDLLNTSRDVLMPSASSKDNVLLGVDRVVFEASYLFRIFLNVTFVTAIILGTIKVFFIVILALFVRRKEKNIKFDEAYRPSVSVIIPAYNEQKVIGKTVRAVLGNHYQPVEVIVVDDGSKDGTYSEAQRLFGNELRVKILHQENRGKAAALNLGIEASKGEILICLDADTIFMADTIAKLVRHFPDKRVGAVAGNVKVGNSINILTYWQEIEYITSQNIDRRAYSHLNAITVVPGAVGAWRRDAVLGAGSFKSDTLAEDMDLTWRIRKNGWIIKNESDAYGFTETPDTVRTLFKQRFRWTFGTLQCLWKHKDMLGRYGFFGTVMMPTLWLFQILFQLLSPIIDFTIFWALISSFHYWLMRGILRFDWQPLTLAISNLSYIAFMYFFFFLIELIGAVIAFNLERENKRILKWLFFQKFFYRQIMYAVAIKSFKTALHGIQMTWGKLERKGTAVSD